MDNLITADEFFAMRDISIKKDAKKIDEYVLLSEMGDFRKLLGKFYFVLKANVDLPAYETLVNGGEFEVGNIKYFHLGLKVVLADYVYSRYVLNRNVQDVPFGFVTKRTDNGDPVDRNTLRDLSRQAQIDAQDKFDLIKLYMEDNKDSIDGFDVFFDCGNIDGDAIFYKEDRISKL